MRIEKKLAALGLELPQPPVPVGNYLPAARVGNLVFTSGQTARINGVRRYVGVVGQEVSQADAYLSARDATLNCLACVKQAVGSLDRVKRVVKVMGFVNAGRDFDHQPAAINGASDLLEQALRRGRAPRPQRDRAVLPAVQRLGRDRADRGGAIDARSRHAEQATRGRRRPQPEPGPGEVLVKTLACGICGSDLHALRHAEQFVEAVAPRGQRLRHGPRARRRDGPRVLRRDRRARAADDAGAAASARACARVPIADARRRPADGRLLERHARAATGSTCG